MKRTAAVILLLAFIFSLAACGEPSVGGTAPPLGTPPDGGPSEVEGEYRLTLTETPLPEGMLYATAQCRAGDITYYGGLDDSGPVLAAMDAGGGTRRVPLPEDCEFIHALCETEDGAAALIGGYPSGYLDAKGEQVFNEYPEGRLSLLLLDTGCGIIDAMPLENAYPEQIFRQMLPRGEDFVLLDQFCLVLVGADGVEKGRVSAGNDSFTAMGEYDGEVLVARVSMRGGASALCALDENGFSLTEKVALETTMAMGLGVDADGAVLVNDMFTSSVSRVDMESGEKEPLLKWHDDLNAAELNGADCVEALPDGGWRFFERYNDAIYGAEMKFFEGVFKEIVIATDTGGAPLTTLIAEFNAQGGEYKVRAVEYGAYDSGGNQERPFDLLRTEIVTGHGPDMFAFAWQNSFTDAAGSGVFEDLLPFIDADPELSRGSFVPGLFNALTADGVMRWLPYDFSVTTFTAPASVVGERDRVTMEEMDAIVAELGGGAHVFPGWMTKGNLLAWMSRFALAQFVDWDAGTCSFDSPDFVALLEKCNEQPSDPEPGGGDLGVPDDGLGVLTFTQIQGVINLCFFREGFGGDYSFTGFPNSVGNGSVYSMNLRFAMASASENKEGVWEFLRFCLLNGDYEDVGVGIPFAADEIDKQIALYMEGIDWYGREVKLNQTDVDKFHTLLDNTAMIEGIDQTLLDIISEEAAAYFSGDRTAEDCAARIQSKASIYVSERT